MNQRITKYIILLCVFAYIPLYGQENYSKLTKEALETMWESKDTVGYRKSLDMYERAFSLFPDSIDEIGLYKVSVLASDLKEYDKAFNYLTLLFELKPNLPWEPNWSYILGEASENEYKNLLSDVRWNKLREKALKAKQTFYDDLQANEKEFYATKYPTLSKIKDGESLHQEIKKRTGYLPKKSQNYSISFAINDSVKTSFFVHLPKKYSPDKSYPLLLFLHGAVRYNRLSDYQLASWVLYDWNRYY